MATTTSPEPVRADPAELADVLPALRGVLEEQRDFRREQLTALIRQDRFGRIRAGRGTPPGSDPRQEVTATLALGAALALSDIEAALSRVDSGRYGSCRRCARDIGTVVLQAFPTGDLCLRCRRRD